MVLTKKVKTALALAAAGVVLVAVAIVVPISARSAERAEVIRQGFLGNLFYGSITDDDGYAAAAERDKVDPDKVYYQTTDSVEMAFDMDGTIVGKTYHKMSALSYPDYMSRPDGTTNTYDFDFDSFDVEVTLTGKVYLCIGDRYRVYTDENDIPQTICYRRLDEDMDLTNQGAFGREG